MTNLVVLAAASDPRPDDNNVVAGWVGFAVFVLLIVAVVVILRSFTKQLKKVDAARNAGVYGDDRAEAGSDDPSDERTDEADGSEGTSGASSSRRQS